LALDTPWSWIRRLEDFGGDYAHIVVDCPSVLDAPDGRLVGECVDGIVLVVRAGVTKARDVERAARGFEGRILGVVLGDDTGSRKRRA
jgi:Mrp family chromosome partitioning ATPase